MPFSDTDSNENRFLYSEDFANAAWTKGGSTLTSNTVVAPNGTTTADTLTDNATTDQHLIVQPIAIPSVGSQYTVSIYAKANTRSQIGLTMHGESYAIFDLSAGTVISTGGYSNVGIISVGNGWYRCYVTITKTNADGNIYYLIFKDGVNPYLGTGTGSIYVWGAQVKYGSTLGKYIATTTAAVTNQGTIENLLTYSEDLTNAAWGVSGVSVTGNTASAPNGSTTADTVFETAITGEHFTERTLTPVTNTQYVFSTYAKYLNRKYLALRIVYNNGANDTLSVFDIQNGTYYGYDGSAPTATSITSVGNGWYRISATFTTPATNPTASLLFRHQFRDDSLIGNYAGNASVGMYVWGSQIETQGTLGPYLPTVASAQSLVNRIGTDRSLGSTSFGYNTWIPNNISLTPGTTYDAMTDVPTNTSATVANYAVLNPLSLPTSGSISAGNLNYFLAGNVNGAERSTIAVTSGKWYWEVYPTGNAGTGAMIGIADATVAPGNADWNTANGYYYLGFNGQKYTNSVGAAYGATYTTTDIIGVALDMDAGTVTFYKNNTSQGVAFTGLTGKLIAAAVGQGGASNISGSFNFGQRPFSYTPPTGYKALNTYNLPDSTILKGNRVMDATTYTGNGGTLTVTNAGSMKSDLLWIKSRSAATDNYLFDSIRGEGGILVSNSTAAETVLGSQMSFNSNGFTVGSLAAMNTNGATYVGWQWQAGQGTTSTNTAGSITSTVSVNATAGFSVVTYTSNSGTVSTVGHGLGVAPSMLIFKNRTSAGTDWVVYHKDLGNTKALFLDLTNAATTSSTYFNNTSPTSTVFTIGSSNNLNNSTNAIVCYAWAEIAGFSKFGSYTGNGSADGPFVYLGFRPKFIMIKNASAANNWIMYDTSRNTFNVMPNIIYANLANAEAGGNAIVDALSNGFKLRNTFADHNGSGNTIIYMAFAENPFKNSNAR